MIDFMQNKALGEEWGHDHFHFAMHVVVPHPAGDKNPLLQVVTSRHVNGHLVATGPLLAAPFMDTPYPMPEVDIRDYTQAVCWAAQLLLANPSISVAYGTGGSKLKARICPLPPATDTPMW